MQSTDFFKYTYSSVPGAEAGDAVACGFPLVFGDDYFEGVADDVPELVVLGFEEED